MVYAGFWKRFFAVVIDTVILWIPSLVLSFVISPYISWIIGLFYKPIFEASVMRATPGKAIMGIVVQTEDGKQLTFQQSYIRFFTSILSGLVLCIGYFMNLFTAKRQTLHDIIAQTVVIEQAPQANVSYYDVWIDTCKKLFASLSNSQAPISNASSTTNAAATGAASVVSNTNSSTAQSDFEKLEKLHALVASGAISQEEYDKKKQEILSKI